MPVMIKMYVDLLIVLLYCTQNYNHTGELSTNLVDPENTLIRRFVVYARFRNN